MATLARSLLRCVKSTPSVLQGSNFMCFKKIETMITISVCIQLNENQSKEQLRLQKEISLSFPNVYTFRII